MPARSAVDAQRISYAIFRQLLHYGTIVQLPAGSEVCPRSDAPAIGVLLKGRLAFRVSRTKRNYEFRTSQRGYLFGNLALVKNDAFEMTSVTEKDSVILHVARSGLRRLAVSEPDLGEALIRKLIHLRLVMTSRVYARDATSARYAGIPALDFVLSASSK